MNNSNFFPLERNRYFYGKMLTARDFETEQRYFNNKRRLLNRTLYGAGVVCGRRYRQIFHGGRSESNAGQHYSPGQRKNGKGRIPDGWQPRRI